MKTEAEQKFDSIIKSAFHETLKPLGFKKKNNNFYLAKGELGYIINVQKSVNYSKENIHFTINNGIFAPKHWSGKYYNEGKEIPVFPTEPECIIRQRIGALKGQNDTWYDVYNDSKLEQLIVEMRNNITTYILPFFDRIGNYDQLLSFLDGWILVPNLERLIILGQLGHIERAKVEYYKLLSSTKNESFQKTIVEYATRFKIV